MTKLTQTTKSIKASDIKREWHLVDAKNKVLGRLTPQIALWLQGKHKANYAPYLDIGDNVVVINAQSVQITGKKDETKVYTRYTGYPGGLRSINFTNLMKQDPRKVIEHAVSGMLPKNKHRQQRLTRLFIF